MKIRITLIAPLLSFFVFEQCTSTNKQQTENEPNKKGNDSIASIEEVVESIMESHRSDSTHQKNSGLIKSIRKNYRTIKQKTDWEKTDSKTLKWAGDVSIQSTYYYDNSGLQKIVSTGNSDSSQTVYEYYLLDHKLSMAVVKETNFTPETIGKANKKLDQSSVSEKRYLFNDDKMIMSTEKIKAKSPQIEELVSNFKALDRSIKEE